MDLEIKQELTQLRGELGKEFARIDQQFTQLRGELGKEFVRIDQKFERIDQKFEQIDQKLDQINGRLDSHDEKFRSVDSEFRIVHTSINKLAEDFHKKCLADEERHATVLKMFDTMMYKLDSRHDCSKVESRVDRHEVRIAALESVVAKNP